MKDFLIELNNDNKKQVQDFLKNKTTHEYMWLNNIFYGIIRNKVVCMGKQEVIETGNRHLIIFSLSELEEKTFPKMMMVRVERSTGGYGEWVARLVLGKFNKRYVAITGGHEENFHLDQKYSTSVWDNAKEIEELQPVELTIDEIAKKFKLDPSQVKIKK